jgi:amidase
MEDLPPPTRAQLEAYAARQHLSVDDLSDELIYTAGALELLSSLAEVDDDPAPVRHPKRNAGRPPERDEDPYNAIIRFCEVKGGDHGPLSGYTIGIKDNIAVAGVPMTNGNRTVPPIVPTEDAVVVERLLDAGATIVAKTNLENVGKGFGVTRNPLNPRFAAGGSSSGSAAAVAAGIVDAALGADQGGSIRNPCAHCSLVGIKATHGLVPSYGLTYWDHTLDNIGPMTKTVADNARLLEVIAGHDARDPQWVRATPRGGNYFAAQERGVSGLTCGVVTEALRHCSHATVAAFDDAQALLRRLGANVELVSVPLWANAPAIWFAIAAAGLTTMRDTLGQGQGHLGRVDLGQLRAAAAIHPNCRPELPAFPFSDRTLPLVVEHIRNQAGGLHLGRAQNLRLRLGRQVDELLRRFDVLLTPTVAVGPSEVTDTATSQGRQLVAQVLSGLDVGLGTLCPLNLTGHPALTVPSGPGDNEMPTGLQVIGSRFAEETVYQVGFAFEQGQLDALT